MDDASAITWDATPGDATPHVPAQPTLLAGRYEIEGLLGVGGMGSVYRARDRELDERVALKILRRDLVADPTSVDRFRREVKLARRVTHRNVARTFDIGEHGGERFLTMELVVGESLATCLARERVLSPARAIAIALAVCDGLAAAHAVGVVHRDLKPENLILAADGRVVLTDFGIARAANETSTRTIGVVIGTPDYMAPEQVEARADVDGRADLYALGAMLFHMLTGEPPWRGDTVIALAAQRLVSPPPDPRARATVGDALANVVLRLLARQAHDRYPTAEAAAVALRACGEDDSEAAMPLALRATAPPPAPLHTPAGVRTVALLAVKNTGSADDAPFSVAMTEILEAALSLHPALRVRSPAEAARGAASASDLRARGRELGAEVVVTASFRVTAEGMARLMARVVSVAEGLSLWAGRLERPLGELFALADDAAARVAESLLVERPPPLPQGARDPEVVALYARARREAKEWRAGANDRAIALLEQAIAVAPDDFWILSAYAAALTRRVEDGDGILEEALEARAMAERAASLSPRALAPQATLALLLLELGDAGGAMRHAEACAPSAAHAPLHRARGLLLADAGDVDAAIAQLARAALLDPSDPRPRWDEARVRALAGDDAMAEAMLDEAPSVPSPAYLETALRVAAWRRDRPRLEALAAELARRPIARRDALLAYARGALGGDLAAEHALLDAQARAAGELPRRRAAGFVLATEVAALRGDGERAIASLAQADAARLADLAWLEGCPLLDALRASPPFRTIAGRVAARARAAISAPALAKGDTP